MKYDLLTGDPYLAALHDYEQDVVRARERLQTRLRELFTGPVAEHVEHQVPAPPTARDVVEETPAPRPGTESIGAFQQPEQAAATRGSVAEGTSAPAVPRPRGRPRRLPEPLPASPSAEVPRETVPPLREQDHEAHIEAQEVARRDAWKPAPVGVDRPAPPANPKREVYLCGQCPAEFTSGGALGGHRKVHNKPAEPPRFKQHVPASGLVGI